MDLMVSTVQGCSQGFLDDESWSLAADLLDDLDRIVVEARQRQRKSNVQVRDLTLVCAPLLCLNEIFK